MQLPAALRLALEEELGAFDSASLRAAAARISAAYRGMDSRSLDSRSMDSRRLAACGGALASELDCAAYLAVRMPATYAAVAAALDWTRQSCGAGSCGVGNLAANLVTYPSTSPATVPATVPATMLDLGSGPGTAIWAAAQSFPSLRSATAIERDPRLIAIARRLAARARDGAEFGHELLTHTDWPHTDWIEADLTRGLPEGSWDLVVCSYALNELGERQRGELIRHAWARTAKLLVVVEPGTRAGFANVLEVRRCLLGSEFTETGLSGARLVAPCPHSLACPMAAAGDWCHFAARVERSADHRRLKDATLGHEDEKFSYIAFARAEEETGSQTPRARIVRHPRLFPGYAQLTLCREGRIDSLTVTRSQKDDWRRLKRLGWGDPW